MFKKSIIISLLTLFFLVKSTLLLKAEVLRVPVVVHVVYHTEEQNISDEIIQSQIEALNRDYRKTNTDISNVNTAFTSLIADAEIEFKLASIDPEGSSTSGITRTYTETQVFGNANIHYSSKGGKDYWESYLNIWVANITPSILGWSSSPETINQEDGVVIGYQQFGITNTGNYDLGRTAVHEVGHWLGLSHLEGLGGCNQDDGISDTPNQEKGYSSCEQGATSCGSLDMTENFMQSNSDDCLLFFTKGQVAEMRKILQNERVLVLTNGEEVLSIANNFSHEGFSFINPVKTGQILLGKGNTNSTIRLTNFQQELAFESQKWTETIPVEHLPTGIYLLHIKNEEFQITKKLIIIN